jgi:thiol:disulfide interchange protein DsbC
MAEAAIGAPGHFIGKNMSFKLRSVLAASILTLVACSASADSKVETELKAKIGKHFPEAPVTSVRPAPIKGLYEIVLGKKMIVYSDAKAEYVIVGEFINTANRQSVTRARMDELNTIDFAKLPFELALKEVRGSGERKLAVFTDPDCPYCKMVEANGLKTLENVTIYRFLMPIASLHPDAARKSKIIWCAKDRLASWKGWIEKGQLPEGKGDCENPVDKTIQLGQELGVDGTPALFFENGKRVPGAIGKDEIEKLLVAATKK